MKLTKKLIALIASCGVALAAGTVGSAIGLTGCSNKSNSDSSSSSSNSSEDSSSSSPSDSSSGTLTGDEMVCQVTVKSEGGMMMSGITICAEDASGNVVKEITTNAKGVANFFLEEGEYSLKLKNIPLGYYQASFGQKLSPNSLDANITLGIELVDEADRAGHIYRVGDVMHDFSVKTFSGETLTLSEMLEEKEMVFLNFWYATCSPCLQEMPWMNNAYNDERYAGKFELIAIHSDMYDSSVAKEFVESKDWTFQFSHNEYTNLSRYFPVTGYPTTVIIDRYGVVTVCETGRLENQTECNRLIADHLGTGYTQDFSNSEEIIDEDKVLPEVTVSDPTNEELNAALGTSGLEFTFDENAYVWPFIPTEVDGRDCIYAPNGPIAGVDAHYTSAVLSMTVNVPEMADYTDYTFVFDYKISSEYQADYFYVLVDGVIVQKYSGPDMIPNASGNLYVPAVWQTSYAYVPVKSGEHTLSFVYSKDGITSDGDDTVYITNLRFEPIGEGQTYVYRNAATERNNDNEGYKLEGDEKDAPRFDKYVNVYLNPEDNLYHVGSENGPLLLANIMDTSTNWSAYPIWNYLSVGDYLEYTDESGEVINLKSVVEEYAFAENHSYLGYMPVNAKFAELLQFITKTFGSGYKNEWLEICCYYDAYNCEQMENPCAGISFDFAIKIDAESITEVGDEARATVNLRTIITPRGYKYAFTPVVSGVYNIKSDRTTISMDPNGLDPIAWFTSSDMSYNSYGELNFSHVAEYGIDFNFNVRLEAGKTYYILASDHDPNKLGDQYEIVVSLVSIDSAAVLEWKECAVQPYVSILDSTGASIGAKAEGIRWGVDEDGYVRALRNDQSFASYVYLDMLRTTYFMEYTIKYIIEGQPEMFNFSNLMIDTNNDETLDKPIVDENGNPYGNYLTQMQAYLAEATAGNPTDELYGFVKVTAELQLILELLTQNIHKELIVESWQCMCYYYKEV